MTTSLDPAALAAMDQALAGANQLLDQLADDARDLLTAGSTSHEVVAAIASGTIDSPAPRDSLALVNAVAVLRIAQTQTQTTGGGL